MIVATSKACKTIRLIDNDCEQNLKLEKTIERERERKRPQPLGFSHDSLVLARVSNYRRQHLSHLVIPCARTHKHIHTQTHACVHVCK
jgi:hypothetical protein